MTDKNTMELTENTAPTKDDLVAIINDPGGTPLDQKVKLENYLKFIGGLTSNTTPALTDLIPIIDDPGGTPAVQAITPGDLLTMKEVISIPIEWADDGEVPPEDVLTLTSGNNKVTIRNFDPTTAEDVRIRWDAPFDLIGTTIKFRVLAYISKATGPANEGWAFELSGASLGDGDPLGAALGAAVKSSITGRSDVQYDRVMTAWSGDVTITDLLAGETAHMKLTRKVADADDTYGQDIGPAGIEIKYTKKVNYA